jgi:hypothetical protein
MELTDFPKLENVKFLNLSNNFISANSNFKIFKKLYPKLA